MLDERRGERLMREAISEAISEVISEAINKGTSEAIRGHRRPSEGNRAHLEPPLACHVK